MIDFITNEKLSTLSKHLPLWRQQMTAHERQFAADVVPRHRMLGASLDLTVKQCNTVTAIVDRYS